MPTQIPQELYVKLGAGDISNDFFTELETEEFNPEALRTHYPELVAHWEVVAKLQSVP